MSENNDNKEVTSTEQTVEKQTTNETPAVETTVTPAVEMPTPAPVTTTENTVPVTESIVKPEEPKETQPKKNKNVIIIVAAIIIVLLVGVFLAYKFYFGNSKRLTVKAIDKFSDKWEKVMDDYLDTTDFGDNYTMTSDVSLKAESEYLQALAQTSVEYVPYANIVKNLQNLDTKVIFAQNKKEKQALIQVDSKLKNADLINVKYLIEDNKQYYLIKGLLDTYVDGGESNYFETLSETDTMMEDMRYVYDVALKSLKKNLKDSYFKNETEKIKVNGKEVSARKIVFTIDDKVGVELATAILKDLKADKKANDILVGMEPSFKDAQVDKNTTIFGDKSGIRVGVYVNNLTYQNLMYKLEMYDSYSNTSLTYQDGKDKEPAIINIYEQNKLVGIVEMTEKENQADFKFLDASKTNLGTLVITNKNDTVTAKLALDIEGLKVNLNMTGESKEVVKSKEMTSNFSLDFNIEMQGMTLANAEMKIDSEIKEGTKIKEDSSKAVPNTTISSTAMQQYMTNVLIQLMS